MIQVDIQKTLTGANGSFDLKVKNKFQSSDFVLVTGRSGNGKSTLLRILAGLVKPNTGKITVDNSVWFDVDNKINLPPQKRQIGYLPQNYTLFPNMTVWQNLAFVFPKKSTENEQQIKNILDLMDLQNLTHRKPHQLSGGQQQRIALARAILQKPKLLLLDEPFSALDPETRQELRHNLVLLLKEFQTAVFLVTHTPNEFEKLATRTLKL